jgi:hypothetical protein
VYVFDVAQTEGADPPEFEHNITGDVGEHHDRLTAFLDAQNAGMAYQQEDISSKIVALHQLLL